MCRELLSGYTGSVLLLFLPSLLLFISDRFQYYQRFHSFIPSTPLLLLHFYFFISRTSNLSLGHTQSLTHTCAHTDKHAHMITDTHNHPAGCMYNTNLGSHTHTRIYTPSLYVLYAPLRQCWGISSRPMFHQRDNTLLI